MFFFTSLGNCLRHMASMQQLHDLGFLVLMTLFYSHKNCSDIGKIKGKKKCLPCDRQGRRKEENGDGTLVVGYMNW